MTLLASSEIVLQITPPQPSSNALPITFAFVPGGPEPMTKGLASFRPLTVVSSVAMAFSAKRLHEDEVQPKRDAERHKPIVVVEPMQGFKNRELAPRRDSEKPGNARQDRHDQCDDGAE